MRDKLPRRYQASKEIAQRSNFEGELALVGMERLREMLYPGDAAYLAGKISIRFEFARNELGVPMVRGQLLSELALECQRCLGAIALPVNLDFSLLIDASDEMVQQSGLDTVYSDDGYIDIVNVVEDELILGLPLVALHEDESCNKYWLAAESNSEVAVRENPFSVLKHLKTTD